MQLGFVERGELGLIDLSNSYPVRRIVDPLPHDVGRVVGAQLGSYGSRNDNGAKEVG